MSDPNALQPRRGYPLPTRSIRIIRLARNSRQNLEPQLLTCKILSALELADTDCTGKLARQWKAYLWRDPILRLAARLKSCPSLCRFLAARSRATIKHIDSVEDAFRRLLMLEIGKNVAALGEVLLNPSDHGFAFFGGVAGLAVAVIGEVGGHHIGSVPLFGFGNAECDVPFAQCLPGRLLEPGRVAELESSAHASRQNFQKLGKHRLIDFKIWRELKQNGPQPLGALQRFQRTEKTLQEFIRALQSLDMREHLMRFDREAEMRGRLRDPILNRRFFYQLAEGVVDFHRIQLARVEIQKLFLHKLLRIKSGLPGRISPSGSADVELRHSRSIAKVRSQIAEVNPIERNYTLRRFAAALAFVPGGIEVCGCSSLNRARAT